MANNILNTRIIVCNDTSVAWENSEKILFQGELAIEFNENEPKIKIGNGKDTFRDLPYASYTARETEEFIAQAIDKIKHTHENKDILDTITASFTTQLKSNYDKAYEHSNITHAPSNAQENVIEAVKLNGEDIIPNKKVIEINRVSIEGHKHSKSEIADFPKLGTASSKDIAVSGNASETQVVMGNDTRLTDARKASDVSAWAKASKKPTYTPDEVGAAPILHSHNDLYYTESEIDSKLSKKSDSSHEHDLSAMINKLGTGTATPSDTEYIIAQDNTDTNIYRRKPMSSLWSYIKSKLSTVATTGSYDDLTNKPTIGNGTITIKQNGTSKGTFALNQTGNTTVELTDNNTTYSTGTATVSGLTKLYTSTGTNTDGTMTQASIKSALDGKSNTGHTHDDRYYTESEVNTKLNAKANSSHTHDNSDITTLDASKITSGTISIERLPKGALERCVIVADDTARFKLTTSSVQTGDTVKVTGTGKMYFIVDDSQLTSEAGYEVYTAGSATSVPWSGVTGKPSSYTPSSHTQAISTITGLQSALDGKSATSHTHDDRYYTESEINTKLNGKSDTSHTHNLSTMINTLSTGESTPADADYYVSQYVGGGTTTTSYHRRPMSALWAYIKSKLSNVAISGSYNDLSNKPTIPSVGNGTITITQNGTTKGTFTTNQSGNTTIALTDTNTDTDTTYSAGRGITLSGTQFKLSDNCTTVTDWNNATATGFYMSASATASNQPVSNAWFIGEVITYNSNYVRQILYRYSVDNNISSGNNDRYERVKHKGTWGSWVNTSVRVAVPSNAKFTDTNTWRGIQNNLTSTSTTDSLSAAQGKALNDKFASYVPTSRTINGKALSGNITLSASDVGASASATANTIALRNGSGHLHATYFNQSSGAEAPSTSSYIMYANSDGYLRKSSLANIKTILGLGSAAYTNSNSYAAASHSHNLEQCGSVGYYGSETANSNGWYKVYSTNLTGHSDHVAKLSLMYGYNSQCYGILNLHLRCNNSSTISAQSLKWETRIGFSAGDVIIVTSGNTWSLYVNNRNTQYGRIKVRVLESTGTSGNWEMKLTSNTTKESTTPTATLTATDGAIVNLSNVSAKLARSGDTNNPMVFNWSGQSGQPTWLWGGTDGTNMYVYNPSNFSVAKAATLTTARTIQTNLGSKSSASFNGSANITPGITGTLAVSNGGTGATTLASGAALIGNGAGAITTRSITNMTSKSYITYNTNLMTTNTLAYWNGAYNTSGTSNLSYCNMGAFGSIVTKNVGDYATASHTHNYAGSSSAGGAATTALACTGNSATATKLVSGNHEIYNSGKDSANGVGGELNNLVIKSWYGVSFTSSCSGTYQNKTAVGINCRSGEVSAVTFKGALSGNASSTTKLATARTIRTNLGSTSTASFDGTANVTPGVTGTLPIANGGTGSTTAAGARTKLGFTADIDNINEKCNNHCKTIIRSDIYNKEGHYGLFKVMNIDGHINPMMCELYYMTPDNENSTAKIHFKYNSFGGLSVTHVESTNVIDGLINGIVVNKESGYYEVYIYTIGNITSDISTIYCNVFCPDPDFNIVEISNYSEGLPGSASGVITSKDISNCAGEYIEYLDVGGITVNGEIDAYGDVNMRGGSIYGGSIYGNIFNAEIVEMNSCDASSNNSAALNYCTTALDYQTAIGHYNNTSLATKNNSSGTTNGTAFVIGNGTSSSKSNAFRVTGTGVTYAKGSYNASGADYAEYAEWADGNPDDEDRRGYFVTFDEEQTSKIRIANEGDYILGIVSGNPCVIGNSDEDWMQRYVYDEFGCIQYEEVEETETYKDDDGKEQTRIIKITKYKENPEYDPNMVYVQREDRKEWSAIGWIGVLSVRDDGSCIPGKYCRPTDGGIATACQRGANTYRVLERVNDDIVKVVLK